MKNAAIIALICFVFLPSISTHAGPKMPYRNPEKSRGACFAQLIHQFRDHRLTAPSDNLILFASENYSFTGSASDLNRFLRGIADLPETRSITVIFNGPEGDFIGIPLTAAAAQSPSDYDWRVRVLQGDVTISIPLAARIPFAEIRVPAILRVDVAPGAPRVASVFARLHNEDIAPLNDAQSK